jgi:hypothetical protein
MSITLTFGATSTQVASEPDIVSFDQPFTYTPALDEVSVRGQETANDGSAPNSYLSLLSNTTLGFASGSGDFKINFDISQSFFATHVGTSITFSFDLREISPTGGTDGDATFSVRLDLVSFPVQTIQNDFLGITRAGLPLKEAQAIANEINAGCRGGSKGHLRRGRDCKHARCSSRIRH